MTRLSSAALEILLALEEVMSLRRLKTAKELAEELNVEPARVLHLAREGLLPCIRLGRQVRFDPAIVEAWLRKGGAAWEGGWRREPR